MNQGDGHFAGCGGRSIHFMCWEPEASPRALILIAHGAGEHCARYRALAEFFCDRGYAVAALDHNGHGMSDGIPGHVNRFTDYLEDLGTFSQLVRTQIPNVPVLLLGHSLGGLIVSLYLLEHQKEFAGAVLSGPLIKSEQAPGSLQKVLITVLSALMPKLGMLQLDANGVSRDPEEVRKYVEDPLVHHGKMSVRTIHELFASIDLIQSRAGEIALPLLLMHGGDDAMTDPKGSQFLHDHVGSTDKMLKIYPGLFHEIFNEPEREQVMGDMLQWCDARLSTPTGI